MLLTALLSDIIYIQRCRLSSSFAACDQTNTTSDQTEPKPNRLANPYAPLSSSSEGARLRADMTDALSRWAKHFQNEADPSVLALYHFVQLQLTCAEMWELPRLAGYRDANWLNYDHIQTYRFIIPEKAEELAWLILDQCGKSSTSERNRLSIWLPITLFMSALVLWHRVRSQMAPDRSYGTLRMLTPFRNEIARLPWPCCMSMVRTLDQLMEG